MTNALALECTPSRTSEENWEEKEHDRAIQSNW